MHPAQAFSANATTFLTHIVGRGFADERYVVQRFRSMLDGDIRVIEAKAPKHGKRRRKAKHTLASRDEVKETTARYAHLARHSVKAVAEEIADSLLADVTATPDKTSGA